jgi:predicted metalloprotease with PDZ domain
MNRTLITLLAVFAALPVCAQAPAAAPAPAEKRADAEKRLESARERLEEAAREVAQISAEIGAPVIERFITSYGPKRSFIGVQLDSSGSKDGARIDEVSPGGPAEKAGLRRGDVIVAVNGKELKGSGSATPVRELTRRLREIEPESKVKLRILRDGKPQDVEVTTRSAHGMFAMPELPEVPLPPMPPEIDFDEHFDFRSMLRSELSGMELATLTPKLGAYFGTEKGVLVVRAPEGDAFRLEDGDVIVSIDGREPKNGSHATRILRSYQAGEKVKLRLMRQRKPLDLEVSLPERQPRERRARLGEATT